MPGFAKRAPQARPQAPTRNTLEAGMLSSDSNTETMFSAIAGSENYLVPRPGSPTQSLRLLADAGDDLASRRGTTTTTDWGMLSQEELCQLCDDDDAEGGDVAYLFDQGNAAAVRLPWS